MKINNTFRKIFKFLENIFLYILIAIFILLYIMLLFYFKKKGTLLDDQFASNVGMFIGWIIALFMAMIHLKKTRNDNKLAKKDEIRKSLEIDAFREINKATDEFSSIITDIAVSYVSGFFFMPELNITNHEINKSLKKEIPEKIYKQITSLSKGIADFVLIIESNEIAVIKFDYLRKYIQHRVEDVQDLMEEFNEYWKNIKYEVPPEEDYSEFKNKCREISCEFVNIQMYLFDYRIELMNSMLGDIFDAYVPVRKPIDPKYKVLTEVAIKEEVEKESQRRAEQFLKS